MPKVGPTERNLTLNADAVEYFSTLSNLRLIMDMLYDFRERNIIQVKIHFEAVVGDNPDDKYTNMVTEEEVNRENFDAKLKQAKFRATRS